MDVLEVMRLDMGGTSQQTRHMIQTEFYREMEEYGFQRA